MKVIVKNQDDHVVIIDLKGAVDFASAEPFRQTCIRELSQKNIVFNLQNLHFVGSDGLSSFMDTMELLQRQSRLKFCCVSSEFKKLFADDHMMKTMDIYENEQSATEAFSERATEQSS